MSATLTSSACRAARARIAQPFALAVFACALANPAIAAETATLINPAAAQGDELAYALASQSGRVVAGTPGESGGSGAIYVFECTGSVCAGPLRVAAGDLAGNDHFGSAVALSGNTLVVGAFAQGSGAVYVFVHSGSTWAQQAKLVGPTIGERFGWSLSLDGDRLAIGADTAGSGAGAAYVFERSGTTWTQQARLTAADAAANDALGRSVSLRGDTLLAGAPFKAGTTAGSYAHGAGYVFVRGTSAWSQQAKLVPADAADGDLFAHSVALADDVALIGAPAARARAGNAYVFARSGVTWVQQAELIPAANIAGDSLGWSVALQGSAALIGAPYALGACGRSHVFRGAGTAWSETGESEISQQAPDALVGWAVAANAQSFFVGAPGYAARDQHRGIGYVFTADVIFRSGFETPPAPATCAAD